MQHFYTGAISAIRPVNYKITRYYMAPWAQSGKITKQPEIRTIDQGNAQVSCGKIFPILKSP